MIQLNGISVAFGGRFVLDDVTWTIKPGRRIGLVGPNGAGKTTLLRIIAGEQVPDAGTVSRSGSTTVGYLQQDVHEATSERTVLEEALRAFEKILALQAEEAAVTEAVAAADDHESESYLKLLHSLERIHTELATLEAHRIKDRAETVLAGLGFEVDELHRPLLTFSGGWRMRVALARLLLQEPDFLLLDEPTNHLDIDSIDWLENYLKTYRGTVTIVSHDRYFLDRMVTSIAELSAGKLTEYAGNYTFYLEDRVTRRMLQQASYENQQKEIADTERFIERFRYKASKARQVQSRIKQLEKLERIAPPPTDEASISFRFPEPLRSGRTVMELSRFSKTYSGPEGNVRVFEDTGPLTIERGDKIALIGKNGSGKSTLARILCGTEPFDGTRTLGYNVELTYFAQHQADTLRPDHTILEALREQARGQSETEIRSLLGAFLFTGDDVFKKISVLSGGEKSRVALARTLLRPANFLILDEPTNHLDIQSIRVLIEALSQYTGSFVIVSHDRHFLDQVVNKIWRADHGSVREFIGNYSEYSWQIQHGTISRLEPEARVPTITDTIDGVDERVGGPKNKEQKRREAEERNRLYRESQAVSDLGLSLLTTRQLRKKYEQLEAEILEKESEQAKIEDTLGNPDLYSDPDRAQATTAAYEAVKAELKELYNQWEKLADLLSTQDHE